MNKTKNFHLLDLLDAMMLYTYLWSIQSLLYYSIW